MDNQNSSKLVVCSVVIAPARHLVFYKFRTWLDQVVRIVVHTFAVEESKIPLDPENPDGYWYCAGDFCDIDESGVSQDLSQADIDYAKCLVAPNIKDGDPIREKMVISGQYGIHYVCHNITNRILYSTQQKNTIIDLDIATTGYEVVVKSALGIYGQNKVEWERRKANCSNSSCASSGAQFAKPLTGGGEKSREDEIRKIHFRAARADKAKSERITDALAGIDYKFYLRTEEIVNEFDSRKIDLQTANLKMMNACATLFSETISIVGRDVTSRIYPGCNIDLQIEQEVENRGVYMVAM